MPGALPARLDAEEPGQQAFESSSGTAQVACVLAGVPLTSVN
jgi:hypothetical protein